MRDVGRAKTEKSTCWIVLEQLFAHCPLVYRALLTILGHVRRACHWSLPSDSADSVLGNGLTTTVPHAILGCNIGLYKRKESDDFL